MRREHKPLSFSTTMRNPERMPFFVQSIMEYEGEVLTNDVIKKIIIEWIIEKLIRPDTVIRSYPDLKDIFYSKEVTFSYEQATFIYDYTEQNTKGHKEAGFDIGWPSRFDTYMKLCMEFGFIYYKLNEEILVSETGKLLVFAHKVDTNQEAIMEGVDDNEKILLADVFLNALVKYQTDNPFRRNLIQNAPFVLFLETVQILEKDYNWDKTGIYRHEIPFITCWKDNDSASLAKYINSFRKQYGKSVSEEIVYEYCLELLDTDNRVRFKMKQIMREGVDDFIRKFRITGLVSIRGFGRLIDINRFELDRVNYVVKIYNKQRSFKTVLENYSYMGTVDRNLVEIHTEVPDENLTDLRQKTLLNWALKMTVNDIEREMKALTSINGSRDPVLKFINGPTRFEFLMSIALKHRYKDHEVFPNYPIDDEGMPTFTAKGGAGDIEVYTEKNCVLVEVTLMRNKTQSTNEIPGITRHMTDLEKLNERTVSALFVAPDIHQDTEYMIGYTESRFKQMIYPYTIDDFIKNWKKSENIEELLKVDDMRLID